MKFKKTMREFIKAMENENPVIPFFSNDPMRELVTKEWLAAAAKEIYNYHTLPKEHYESTAIAGT